MRSYENPNFKDPYVFIRDWFVAPILRHKPNGIKPSEFLNEMWGVKDRPIKLYTAKRKFECRALMKVNNNVPTQGLGLMRFKHHDQVMVRLEKEHVDCEIIFGSSHRYQVFQLTYDQWRDARIHLVEKLLFKIHQRKKPAQC